MSEIDRKHVVSFVFNGVIGDSRVIKTAKSALSGGYRATLIGISTGKESVSCEMDGVSVLLFPKRRMRKIRDDILLDTGGVDVSDIACTIMKLNPDLLHTHDVNGLFFGAALMRYFANNYRVVPWVHDIHEYVAGCSAETDEMSRKLIELEARYIKEPDALITVSPELSELLQRDHILPVEPEIIYNCPEQSAFQDTYHPTLRERLGLGNDKILVVWVGGVNEFRGTHTIVEAVARIPNAHLAILSNRESRYLENLKEIAVKFNAVNRFHVLSYVPYNEVTSFIRDADIGVHAGTHELVNMKIALPNKLFEYLHAGIPCVVSDVPAMSSFVRKHKVGEVFEAEKVDSAIQAIMTVIDEREKIKNRITNNIKREYSWEEQSRKIERIYKKILDESIQKPMPKSIDDCRILHGYTWGAGQPWMCACAQRELGLHADAVMLFKSDYCSQNHRAYYVNSSEMRYAFARLRLKYDIFHVYCRPMYFSWVERIINYLDILFLRLEGKIVIVNFRGSEVRLPSKFAQDNCYNYVSEHSAMYRKISEKVQRKYIDFVLNVASAVTVVDPELQTYVPEAKIVPRSINLDDWEYIGVSDRDVPLIIHAPTDRLVKGTENIISAVKKLKEEGLLFDFKLVEHCPNSDAKEIYKGADIVIDQLRIGWYGVLAVECMALGKAVVSYIREDLIKHFNGDELPVASANPDDIADVLRELISDKDKRKRLGKNAREYCERVHDSRVVAKEYRGIYEHALSNQTKIKTEFLDKMFHEYDLSFPPIKNSAKGKVKSNASPDVVGCDLTIGAEKISYAELGKKQSGGVKKGLFDPPYSKIIPRLRRRIRAWVCG